MQVHQVKFRLKKSKRIGRGGKKGSYSGRGIKGQKARAGHRIRPALRDFILKWPKKRGWKNIKLEKNVFEVNLEKINEKFNEGEIVSAETLKEKGILKIPKRLKKFQIKILGQGNLTKPLIFDYRLLFSEKAKEKIENSGSKIQ
jgi:large subunit ribosomal protein L15